MDDIKPTVGWPERLLHRLRGSPITFSLASYREAGEAIRERETELQHLGAAELRERAVRLRSRARPDAALDKFLVEAFAFACEAARRELGMRPYDVQLLAGIAMHRGCVVEMQTGEGKTLAAVLPAYLNALTGQGAHVLTCNDYLARRDAEWMGPVYEALGLDVGFVQEGMSTARRRQAYAADVTYVTAREAGFDYLRDGLCTDAHDFVHRPFHCAIVDEADSLLVDEARIPLVLAGSSGDEPVDPRWATGLVRKLEAGVHYATDEHDRNAFLTEAGFDEVEAILECGNLHDAESLNMAATINLALHAEVLLQRDVDYIVRGPAIELVDEFTGRIADKRRWPDGLQAALEAKESLAPVEEGEVLGSIALQQFIPLYPRLCGMTGTAQAAASELWDTYGLRTTVIPTHRPCIRVDYPDSVYPSQGAKRAALVAEISRANSLGRPVLVGTASVKESEQLADALQAAGTHCQLLNARNDQLEAEIISEAGALGAVTISTNMAGRGTDIRLGGRAETDRDAVVALGGLSVIGTNRHSSRRTDDQLRGRAGRQGDPGSTRFLISLEDDLLRRIGAMDRNRPHTTKEDQTAPLDSRSVHRKIAHAQRVIEGENFEIRKTLRKYSELIESQRLAVDRWRQDALQGTSTLQPLRESAETAARWRELCEKSGQGRVQEVERRLTLLIIGRAWAAHLQRVAQIRESIHLHSYNAGAPFMISDPPLVAFRRQVVAAFDEQFDRLDDELATAFLAVKATDEGVDLDDTGLAAPSATWTYIINDNPFGDPFARFFKGLKRKL